ncbi:HD domain-containing protein [Gottfriedia acidiceleris]|uniref:HD domain-containing protein n=1 Tax=Gottfriedia acidiceleris TaxID=371036 RepID=UPI00339AD9D6
MELSKLVDILTTSNAKIYLVGGAVRDQFLGLNPKDKDYCVTGISQEMFEHLFPTAELQGKDFPVYRMNIGGSICEVALARKERKVSEGHNGFSIHTSPDIRIQDDLARRDITINAMAIDLTTDALIDPFLGFHDLRDKIIKATSEAFVEDPLRVYRAARFAAQFDFRIDDGTKTMMNELKSELSTLSIERVTEEMKKALLSDNPSRFFRYLKETNVLDVHFPEIDCLSDCEQHPIYHPEGNVFEHTMQGLDAARYFTKEMSEQSTLKVMFGILLHDVGKKVTKDIHPIKGTPTYHKHESAGVPIAEAFLDRFKLQSIKKAVLFGVEYHMFFHDAFTATKPAKAVDFMEGKFELGQDGYFRKPGVINTMGIQEFVALCMADAVSRIKYSNHLELVLFTMYVVIEKFDSLKEFKMSTLVNSLAVILGDHEAANKLATDIIIVAKHKNIMEIYHEESKHVTCSLDMDELKERYSGEALGYQIHSDKRKQRARHMNKARSIMKDYIAKLV